MSAELDVATAGLDAPLAAVDLAALEHNASDLVRRAAGVPLRLVSKSVRCRSLLDRVLAMPGFRGLMCYSLPEALWHCQLGTSNDILVAYPSVHAGALGSLAGDPSARAAVTLMIDSTEHLDYLDRLLGADHPRLRVCLELDASWRPLPGLHVGTRRSPLFRPRQLRAVAERVCAHPGFELVGVMAYEGQIAGLGDHTGSRARDAVVRWMQQRSAAELAERRAAAVRAVGELTRLEFVNGGGSGSLETTGADPSITEVAAGSALLGPTLFDGYSRFRPRPAAWFALPVTRRPARRFVTLFSGGYPASGPPSWSRIPRPAAPAGLSLTTVEGAGEVQTPVSGPATRDLRLGDRVWLRHAKAGELAERFTEYHLVRDGRVEAVAPTYRGEGKSFG